MKNSIEEGKICKGGVNNPPLIPPPLPPSGQRGQSSQIDYKKLLKRCMMSWLDDEGQCWNGLTGRSRDLSKEEKDAVMEIYKELVHDE